MTGQMVSSPSKVKFSLRKSFSSAICIIVLAAMARLYVPSASYPTKRPVGAIKSEARSEYEMASFVRQSAHRVIDQRHSLSTDRWDLERRFVVLSDKDLLETGAASQEEEDPAMNSLLDSLTTMCVCNPPRQPKYSSPVPTRKRQRVVYPVEGFSQSPLNAKHVVRKRLSTLQNEHFFRPVSEDDLVSV